MIRLTDLARPQIPLPIRMLNALGGPVARRAARLHPDSLHAAARRKTRLDDFGDPDYLPRLELLCRSLETEADLSPFGRLLARGLLVGLLTTRLRLEELRKRHPEIATEPLERPIVIAGLPRTGTTHLHNLLAQIPELRTLPYWESLEPIAASALDGAASGAKEDPRIDRCRKALVAIGYVMPHFAAMHEMTADGPHEEIQLLAVDFASMLFEATYHVPSYAEWYKSADHTPSYRYLRRLLQALQFVTGRKRWALKSPQHLERMRPLVAAFPDAVIVQTHRDPVRITASVATMIAYTRRMQAASVDPVAIGRSWAARTEDLLRASIEDRRHLDPERILDLRFHEYMRDQPGAVARVLAAAGQSFTDAARARVDGFLAGNPRGRHGLIDYRLEDVGLDAAERRRALGFYQEFFGVPDEN